MQSSATTNGQRVIPWRQMFFIGFLGACLLISANSSWHFFAGKVVSGEMTLERWKRFVAAGDFRFHEIDQSIDPEKLVKSGSRTPVGRVLLYTNDVPGKPVVVIKRAKFQPDDVETTKAGFNGKAGLHFVDVRMKPRRISIEPPFREMRLVVVVDGKVISTATSVPGSWTLRLQGTGELATPTNLKPDANAQPIRNWT